MQFLKHTARYLYPDTFKVKRNVINEQPIGYG